MSVVILCAGFANGASCAETGLYLREYVPEAHNGRGKATWTKDVDQAMRLPDALEAHRLWTTVPSNHPIRSSDGRPNRPLTAFSIVINTVDE